MHIKNTEQLGSLIRTVRKINGITQKDLALASGTGLRFVIELEKGKPSCQIEKVLQVLSTLGVKLEAFSPKTTGKT